MNAQRQNDSSGSRDRLMGMSAAIIFAVALLIVGNYWWRSNSVLSSAQNVHRVSPGSDREAYIARAKELRGSWHTWAEANKDLLQKLKTIPSDKASIVALRNEIIESRNETPGVEVGSLATGAAPSTWQLMDLSPNKPVADTIPQNGAEQAEAHNEGGLQADFGKYHDIAYSYSMRPGMWRVTLWVSGRITESEMHLGERIDGKETQIIEGEEREIAPLYGFTP